MAMVSTQLDYSTLAISLLVVVSCLVVVAGSFRGRRNGGAALPSPPALPIIGNLHQLGRGCHHRTLQALARRHGPLFLLRLGSVPTVVVSSAAVAEAVLRAQDHVFCGRPQQHTARGMLYGCRDVAFSPYGERWRQLRRIAVVHLLGARRVDSLRALRHEEVASLVDRIRAGAGGGGDERRRPLNVTELIVGLTNAVISRSAFGSKLGGMDPGAVREMIREVSYLLETIAVSDVFPRLRWVDWATGLDARMKATAGKLDAILESALREHEESSGDDDGEARDLLDDLLSIAGKEDGQGFKLDRTDVKGLILDLFIAGTDTTYKSIEWAMAELIKNPREMEKVQAEVRGVAKVQGGAVVEEDLDKMILLQAAMKEAMRLHPPVPLLVPREAIQDTELLGYVIPTKTRVMINAWAIGRDNNSWEDAEEFRPERFLCEDSDDIDYSGKDCRFIPFGAGRRGCPGVAFATRLAELTLASMLCHFDWELPNGQVLESFEVVESSGFSPGLKSALNLVAKPM